MHRINLEQSLNCNPSTLIIGYISYGTTKIIMSPIYNNKYINKTKLFLTFSAGN